MTESFAMPATEKQINFDEAFALHHRTVFRVARNVVGDSGLAEDVTQEVFIRLYKNPDAVPTDDLLKAWLIRVALNLSKNTIRGNSRANAREETYFKQAEENAIFEPEAELEKKEQIETARRTLAKVKEPLRSCLLLKQQGLSYKEIAETLDLNETSIGTYVARGRQEFIKFYGKSGC